MMKKVFIVFGTRPEAIKMSPVICELLREDNLKVITCFTGQHKELVYPILSLFRISVDYSFDVMKPKQDLFYLSEELLRRFREVLLAEKPDIVLVQGDTTSAFIASLAAYYLHIPVGHIEAGLRTYARDPFPEEFNRIAIDAISSYFFVPTDVARCNLLREGKKIDSILVTGNTVIDTFHTTILNEYVHPELEWAKGSKLILLTAHRRENQGEKMQEMFWGIRNLLQEYPNVKFLFPVHPSPAVKECAHSILGDMKNIHLIPPLDVVDFHNILKRCYFVLTDSGGIQEEAPSFGKPVLIMRESSEREEGVSAGCAKIIGTSSHRIYEECKKLLDDDREYNQMITEKNPYGDGFASERIAHFITHNI